jgi:hypothetical protein
MISSFWIGIDKLLQLQELVKAHDLRFVGKPIISGDRAYVVLDGRHLSMAQCNAFNASWSLMTSCIVETHASRRKLWRNRIKLFFGSVLQYRSQHAK